MKFDKDALIKHRFWVLAVVSVPLALIAIFMLLTSVSASIDKRRDDLKGEVKKFQSAGDIPSADDIDKAKIEADKVVLKESEVWGNAYKDQAKLVFWPTKIEDQFEFSRGLFANEIQALAKPEKVEDWPQDKDDLLKDGSLVMHGLYGNVGRNFMTIKDRKGNEVKFNRTANFKLLMPDVKDSLAFNQLPDAAGKLLAVKYQAGKYFNDPLTDDERLEYKDAYHGQIEPILQQIDPLQVTVDRKGGATTSGVVQLKGWSFKKGTLPSKGTQKFLRFVADEWSINHDISQEAWIAQEDLWIQNEIYRLVRLANDSVSNFEPVLDAARKPTVDAKTGAPLLRNAYFDLAARLVGKDKLEIVLVNRLPRRQKLDMEMLFQFEKDNKAVVSEKVRIPGTPLGARSSEKAATSGDERRTIIVDLPPGITRKGVAGVEQVLTWETAAIRRIDQVTIGSQGSDEVSHSHRTFVKGLVPFVEKKEAAAAGATDGAQPGTPPGGAAPLGGPMGLKGPGVAAAAPPPGAGFGGAQGGAGGNKEMTPNGLWTERYLEVSKQGRRLPVALALIVDQDHVDRVQTAFNNSKMRFLMTQVLINHYPYSLKPAGTDPSKGGQGGFDVPAFPFPGAGPMGPMIPGGGGEGFPLGGVPDPGTVSAGGVQDLEANLELVIYGVVTLYERYPPRPAPDVASAPAPAAR